MAGVSYGKSRKKKPVEVRLISPTGARILVSEERAEQLLSRAPYTMPDGSKVGYEVDEDEDEPTSVEKSEEKAAAGNKREERK